MIIKSMGRVNVPTPGTPIPLSTDSSVTACRLFFQTIPGLTGQTYVGVPGMSRTSLSGVARVLAANPSGAASETFGIQSQDGKNSIVLSEYAIDANVGGEGLLVTYWQE